ncbi:hypothetical protein [Rhodoferax sp. UBA5149]|uniref:hypothetical protein n=1 Tax=Rhodoferax sp. UBA5149 TaxID=1947379 RepID=UPI0025FB4212|nr:hypothetical protein [Rhodoferax sp. UBA5149]
MQLPPLDRTPSLRPSGADVASVAANRAIPVPPVSSSAVSKESTPGVVNLVNQANKPSTGEAVYTSVSDPAQRGSEAATALKDWTIHRPAPEKVEDPPPVPLSKVLLEQIKSIWAAGAGAIQVQHAQNLMDMSQPKPNPNAMPGVLATEVLTYSPSKINKTQNI